MSPMVNSLLWIFILHTMLTRGSANRYPWSVGNIASPMCWQHELVTRRVWRTLDETMALLMKLSPRQICQPGGHRAGLPPHLWLRARSLTSGHLQMLSVAGNYYGWTVCCALCLPLKAFLAFFMFNRTGFCVAVDLCAYTLLTTSPRPCMLPLGQNSSRWFTNKVHYACCFPTSGYGGWYRRHGLALFCWLQI